MSVVGLDIGGANLKASDGLKSISRSFPLWKSPERLPDELISLLGEFHPYGPIAATMTGELADCFSTRSLGVQHIVEALQTAARTRQLALWQTGGEFFSAEEALDFPELVAAANWHALATWVGRACPAGLALLIDIGSTTTDLIPIQDSLPIPVGTTDFERLCSRELVYTGVRRTPLFAVAPCVSIRGEKCPLAAELFSTTLDLAILLGDLPEEPDNTQTANGRPATMTESLHRLARSICSDCDDFSAEELLHLAQHIQSGQIQHIAAAMMQVFSRQLAPPDMIVLAGEGEFLAQKILLSHFSHLVAAERLSLHQVLGETHSQSACAYALAKLGTEQL